MVDVFPFFDLLYCVSLIYVLNDQSCTTEIFRFFLHVLAKFAVNERDEFGHAFWFYLKKSLNSKLWGELDFSDKKCERGEE